MSRHQQGKTRIPGRGIRLLLLLIALAWVAVDALADRLNTTDWDNTLWVGVYPVNADGSRRAAEYIAELESADFSAVDAWFAEESRRHGLARNAAVSLRLAAPLAQMPPLPPAEGLFATMWWSLRLRWWADDHDRLPGGLRPDVRLYLLYYDPATNPALPHSLGLQKGLVGIVHAFADREYAGSNRVVLAHELLHTLGASDKYDLATGQPLLPQGYADPGRRPLYPQPYAEIMGGRKALSASESEMPRDLDATRIGAGTAAEINWR